MKITVNYGDEKLVMKTSIRAGEYSIRFHKLKDSYASNYNNWGHLNKQQAYKLYKEWRKYLLAGGMDVK